MNQVPDANDIVFSVYSLDFWGFFQALYEKFTGGDWEGFRGTLEVWWNVYSVIAILLSILFFAGFIYAKIRLAQLHEIELEHLKEAEARWATQHSHKASKNVKWEEIQRRVSENNPESWRLAIIEADILLDETLTNAGYVGQSIGEKLKTANPTSFTTVQDAWEAHKVRNEIAHVGSDFVLTKRIAQEAIMRFERVFREFEVI